MELRTRIRWLQAGSLITIAFGVAIAAAAAPALSEPLVLLLKLVIPGEAAGTGEPAFRLLSAISGGVLIGWGAMIWVVATELYPSEPRVGRKIILVAVSSWFVVDSTMSVAAGVPLNSVLNVGFLLIFAIPVWRVPAAADVAPASDWPDHANADSP